jgi:arylsulfatase A-like enzyme
VSVCRGGRRASSIPRLAALGALLAACALGSLACERLRGGPPDAERLAALRTRQDVSIVFLLVDTLRADRLGSYGHAPARSPRLDALAASGVRFARVGAQSTWTKTSMASQWTGMWPRRVGVLRYDQVLAPEARTAPEALRAAGFRTHGLFRNPWLSEIFGFARGFDGYRVPAPRPLPAGLSQGTKSDFHAEGSDRDLIDEGVRFLEVIGDQRFLLYLHFMDVHQYVSEISADPATSYPDRYDGSVTWLDGEVGRLLDALAKLQLRERTIVVLSSDHGEGFYERGQELGGHGGTLYRETIQVPWIVSLPFPLRHGVVIDELVANVDVWPTLLDLLGLPPLPAADGMSLAPRIAAAVGTPSEQPASPTAATPRPVFAALERSWNDPRRPPSLIVSVDDGRHRLIREEPGAGAAELYDQTADPQELVNRSADAPTVVADLGAKLDEQAGTPAIAEGGPPSVDLGHLMREQLRALGYAVGN